MHTASPEQYPWQREAWYVTTDQGVVLGGPYPDESAARGGGNEVAAELRAAMRRERFSERTIADRVAALRVGFGIRGRPHGLFRGWFA